jgi:hypothetical protein
MTTNKLILEAVDKQGLDGQDNIKIKVKEKEIQ